MGLFGEAPQCLFTREICKTKTVMVKTLLVSSVYLHGRAGKKTTILKQPYGIVQLEAVSSREGSHGYLDVWWPQKKHLVFKQRLDQTFFIQAKIPLHKSQSKMATTKVFCVQGTALSKSGSWEIRHKLFAFHKCGKCAMPISDNTFQMHIHHLSSSQKWSHFPSFF